MVFIVGICFLYFLQRGDGGVPDIFDEENVRAPFYLPIPFSSSELFDLSLQKSEEMYSKEQIVAMLREMETLFHSPSSCDRLHSKYLILTGFPKVSSFAELLHLRSAAVAAAYLDRRVLIEDFESLQEWWHLDHPDLFHHEIQLKNLNDDAKAIFRMISRPEKDREVASPGGMDLIVKMSQNAASRRSSISKFTSDQSLQPIIKSNTLYQKEEQQEEEGSSTHGLTLFPPRCLEKKGFHCWLRALSSCSPPENWKLLGVPHQPGLDHAITIFDYGADSHPYNFSAPSETESLAAIPWYFSVATTYSLRPNSEFLTRAFGPRLLALFPGGVPPDDFVAVSLFRSPKDPFTLSEYWFLADKVGQQHHSHDIFVSSNSLDLINRFSDLAGDRYNVSHLPTKRSDRFDGDLGSLFFSNLFVALYAKSFVMNTNEPFSLLLKELKNANLKLASPLLQPNGYLNNAENPFSS